MNSKNNIIIKYKIADIGSMIKAARDNYAALKHEMLLNSQRSETEIEKYSKNIDKLTESIKTSLEKEKSEIQEIIKNDTLLQSASELWEHSKHDHNDSLGKTKVLGWYYAAAAAGLILAIYFSIIFLLTEKIKEYQSLTIATLGTLFVIVFWIGRIISRTLTTHQHLSHAAREKKAFIETYIILAKSKVLNISDQERLLMLSSVFKPSSYGLIKDEGTTSNPMELIAKALSNPSRN
jgi:ABC-type multidrug transport system fused ATPase/permease subunit